MYWLKKLFKWFLQIFSKETDNSSISTEALSHASEPVQEEEATKAGTDAFSSAPVLSDETIAGVNKLKEEVRESLRIAGKTRDLVIFGFFALAIVVIGIAFGYWEFIYTASKNDDYRYNMSEKIFKNTLDISEVKNDLKELKACLILGGWKYCLSE